MAALMAVSAPFRVLLGCQSFKYAILEGSTCVCLRSACGRRHALAHRSAHVALAVHTRHVDLGRELDGGALCGVVRAGHQGQEPNTDV